MWKATPAARHRVHCRFEAQAFGNSLRKHPAVFVHREHFQLETMQAGELLGGVRDGVVLHRADQDVIGAALLSGAESRPAQRQVVGFRAAAGEDHFVRVAVQALGQHLTRRFQGGFSLLPKAVHRGGVAKLLLKIGQHGCQHA